MSYNVENFPKFVNTAGKITVLTAVGGLAIFLVAFLFNAGTNEILKVEAVGSGSASTTLTVLNTPPQWDVFAYEQIESSTSTPTNSGSLVRWTAVASDSNLQPYFLIICSGSATPTPAASLPPTCVGGTQWGVSTSTVSGQSAFVSTSTLESAPFNEQNTWYGWICDSDTVNPRCNNTASQGTNATNSSPFFVNRRPVFTTFANNSPKDPGQVVTFSSTSSDPDVVTADDFIVLHVCNLNDFSTTTIQCGAGGTIASTTASTTNDNATALFTLPSVIQDDLYNAYGFIVDQHGHSATGGAQGTNSLITVNNVAPSVSNGAISLNGGSNITLTNPGGQTTNFPLAVTVTDANSCRNVASTSEVTSLVVSVFRTSIGSTTCNGTAGAYNPNNCYVSGVATTTWNVSCTASSTSCTGPTDPTVDWSCTFPLWFLADPTDSGTPYATTTWSAAVAGVDDDNATGTLTTGTTSIELLSFPALNLLTAEIPYGALEPGSNTGTLNATTTMQSLGNTGLNQALSGESMCIGYSFGSPCRNSSTSTVAESYQQFATTSVAYGSGGILSSTTPGTLQIRIPKTTSTSTYSTGITYWGIEVPGTITLAGAYTGLNTFSALVSSSTNW